METKFPTLLSPLVIGKYVVKNRMESANAIPHFLQSAETYPAPDTITYYEDLAKSGAAIVTVSPYFGKKEIQRKAPLGDVCPKLQKSLNSMAPCPVSAFALMSRPAITW